MGGYYSYNRISAYTGCKSGCCNTAGSGPCCTCDCRFNVLDRAGYGGKALFCDSGGAKADITGVPYPRTRSDWYQCDGQSWNPGPDGVVGARWAHEEGGNVVSHNGHGKWVSNILNAPSGYYYGWPNYCTGLFATWNTTLYGGTAGIDYWFEQ